MNILVLTYYMGFILWIEAALMLPPLLIAVSLGEQAAIYGFAVAIGAAVLVGALLHLRPPKERTLYPREGFVIVAGSWLVMSLFGALPFWVSGEIPFFVDALFETISGFTTTGASILTEIESLSRSILYWRSFTHWVGGMGVLVFMMALLPAIAGGSMMHVLRAESPGPIIGKLAPKMGRSAQILYGIYFALTALEVVLLLAGGMPLFDSLTTAFGTAGTGGFSVRNASIAAYESNYLQTVIAVFMMLFGVNFNVYYLFLVGKFTQAIRGEEVRAYFGIITAATVAIALNIYSFYGSLRIAFHHSFFQVSSIITTTGFATANFDLWPEFSKTILVLLMIFGASAGSTGGGIKTVRVLLYWKMMKSNLQRTLHPNSTKTITLDGKPITAKTQQDAGTFLTIYCAMILASVLLISVDNFGFTTNVTAVLATLNNIGPGLEAVGPVSNFSGYSMFSKLVLSFDMLAGRLELLPVLLLFTPDIWKYTRLRSR